MSDSSASPVLRNLPGLRPRGLTQSLRREPEVRLLGSSGLSLSSGPLLSSTGSPNTASRPLRANSPGTPKLFVSNSRDSPTSSEYSENSDSTIVSLQTDVDCQGTIPPVRRQHASAFFQSVIYVHGGLSVLANMVLSDLCIFNPTTRTWIIVQTEGSPALFGHCAVVAGSSLFLFGGITSDFKPSNKLYEYSFGRNQWREVTPKGELPCPRMGASAHAYEDSIIVFGGLPGADPTEVQPLDDHWEYHIGKEMWSRVQCTGTKPSARFCHATALCGDNMYLYGGIGEEKSDSDSEASDDDGENALSDFFVYRLRAKSWLALAPSAVDEQCHPGLRRGHTLSALGSLLILLGGAADQAVYCYLEDSKKWVQLRTINTLAHKSDSSSSISNETARLPNKIVERVREFHSAVARDDQVILFGGSCKYCGVADTNSVDVLSLQSDPTMDDETTLDDNTEDEHTIPRGEWMATLLRDQPEALRLYHQMRPFLVDPQNGLDEETLSFSREPITTTTEYKYHLSYQVVLQLIIEHLHTIGYSHTAKAIEEESRVPYMKINPHLHGTRLMNLFRLAKRQFTSSMDVLHRPIALSSGDDTSRPKHDVEVEAQDHRSKESDASERELALHLWEAEVVPVESELVGKQQQVMAGTLNSLITEVVVNPEADTNSKRVFFATFHSFTSPQVLLVKLLQYYERLSFMGEEPEERWRKAQVPLAKSTTEAIALWLEMCPLDFVTDSLLLFNVNYFSNTVLVNDGFLPLSKSLRNTLEKALTSHSTLAHEIESDRRDGGGPREHSSAASLSTSPSSSSSSSSSSRGGGSDCPEPKVPKDVFSRHLRLRSVDAEEIARQLTLLVHHRFLQVQASELLDMSWRSIYRYTRAPNLVEMLAQFEATVEAVAREISEETHPKARLKQYEKWVQVATHLWSLHNYHSAFAVVEGLQHSLVRDLARQLSTVSVRHAYAQLTQATSSDNNYADYRATLSNCGAVACVPNIAVVLSDLETLEQDPTLPRVIQRGQHSLINFAKWRRIAACIFDLQAFQQVRYRLQTVYQIRLLLLWT